MQEWPEGSLVNPIDLLDFESSVAPAMYRVFGTVLIAASDQVASQVLAKCAPASTTSEHSAFYDAHSMVLEATLCTTFAV
jgi:chromosome segregation ATPase